MNNTVQAPVGGDILRDAMLQELGIYEMYQIMKLYEDWETVVGPIVSQHAKLISITPPIITVEIAHTVWMQEMAMRKPQIIEALQEYYGQPMIEDMKVQLPRRPLGTQASPGDQLDMTPIEIVKIDFHKIQLPESQVHQIEESVRIIEDESLRSKVFQTQIEQAKKEWLLEQDQFHRCPGCGRWLQSEESQVCPHCEYKKYRKIIQSVKGVLRKYPHYKYDQLKAIAPWCTYEWYEVAKRESIRFYLTKLYQGSKDANDMYWATMLITSKSQDELTFEQVVNITNKYRWNEDDKMQVKSQI
ncbi:DUF721 domain-containing protein [Veillonella sp. CHU740]|uniref:DUF721 domain-containing protein n=1 Tax=Veillonella sp. CHU740 TaxID=2490950 RepID=UPI000F8C8635|nr:DUF721 domain-containing protein [Veillonella sp. CHU740]